MPNNDRTHYQSAPAEDEEELKGLLSESTDVSSSRHQTPARKPSSWSAGNVMVAAFVGIMLISGGALVRGFLISPLYLFQPLVEPTDLLSNGTHEFKRTVLLVSIDGLRADYLDRGLTPHLLAISKKGLRAKFMKPVFPTLTFPNHWSLMTGLYAESHGIVANEFWDPVSQNEFHYNRPSHSWNASWWLGEPMWETAEMAGVITANLMWPGPPQTSTGGEATYFIPFRYDFPLTEKLDQILSWVDLPIEERPQLITVYEPTLDVAGHSTGPMSEQVNATLLQVDEFARDLHTALVARNLSDIVDVVFVSDHGMTDTSHPTPIFMEDIIGEDGTNAIEHTDGWPLAGLRFDPNTDEALYVERLKTYAAAHPDQLSFYTHETMPTRYHFSNNIRIAPAYIVPRIGYMLTKKGGGDVGLVRGTHGYDNDEPSMHAIFIAHGPFSTSAKTAHQLLRARGESEVGWYSVTEDSYIMQGFQNVEIYALVMRLLGLELEVTAKNNGTEGFWDRYL